MPTLLGVPNGCHSMVPCLWLRGQRDVFRSRPISSHRLRCEPLLGASALTNPSNSLNLPPRAPRYLALPLQFTRKRSNRLGPCPRGQLVKRHPTQQRHEQLPRRCHNLHGLSPRTSAGKSLAIPLAQRTIRFKSQRKPRSLNGNPTVVGLANTAVVGRAGPPHSPPRGGYETPSRQELHQEYPRAPSPNEVHEVHQFHHLTPRPPISTLMSRSR